jgi:hypothetical protein
MVGAMTSRIDIRIGHFCDEEIGFYLHGNILNSRLGLMG